jgi:hypothetical protein
MSRFAGNACTDAGDERIDGLNRQIRQLAVR